jgi:hypothetical protein
MSISINKYVLLIVFILFTFGGFGTILYDAAFTHIETVDTEVTGMSITRTFTKASLVAGKIREENMPSTYRVIFSYQGRTYISVFPNSKFGGWSEGMHRPMQYVCSPVFGLGGHLEPLGQPNGLSNTNTALPVVHSSRK